MKSLPLRFILVACTALCSCVTQTVPNHGGGKRFFYEQAIIAKATESAVEGLNLDGIPVDNPIDLFVIAMGDEGGGSDGASGALSFLSLGKSGSSSANSVAATVPAGGGGGISHAFANARDIEFVRGKVLQAVASKGIPVSAGAKTAASVVGGALYVLVSELGTLKEGINLFVYNETKLSSRVAMEAFFVPKGTVEGEPQGYVPLGEGACTTQYSAAYLLSLIHI